VRLASVAAPVAVNIAAGLFVLPFFLFSATAGQLADKYDKAAIIRWVKLAEIGIMALAAVGFARGDAVLLIASLFLMACTRRSSGGEVLDPAAGARREELVGGNALIESATFLAILLARSWRRARAQKTGASVLLPASPSDRGHRIPRESPRPRVRRRTLISRSTGIRSRDGAQPPLRLPQPHGVPLAPRCVLFWFFGRCFSLRCRRSCAITSGQRGGGHAVPRRVLDRIGPARCSSSACRSQGRDRSRAFRRDR